jgi:hypothetical protein
MSDELALRPDASLATTQSFELLQREAIALSKSNLIPDHFKNNVIDCIRIIEAARVLRAPAAFVAQQIYFVHGKPSWASKFIISCINSSQKFSQDLDFEMTGEGDNLSCRAWTVSKKTGQKLIGPSVSVAMAKKEGWWSKSGSKWPTMTELMLQYRAATAFGNTRCPEILQGFPSREELEDMKPAKARTLSETDFGRRKAAPDSEDSSEESGDSATLDLN